MKILLIIIMILQLCSCSIVNKDSEDSSSYENSNNSSAEIVFPDVLLTQKSIIHAMGEIDGYTYTNSLEAFNYYYEKGARVFEVDFDYLDNHLICCHDYNVWKTFVGENVKYTYDNFMCTPLTQNGYHALDIDALALLLDEYEDIFIVTDTKYNDELTVKKQFKELYAKCSKHIDRIIPQIYTKDMYYYVNSIYSFDYIIFTLYFINNWDSKDIAEFMVEKSIPIVTMWASLCSKEVCEVFKEYGIIICSHTINSLTQANDLFLNGCDVIYTDSIVYKEN